MIGYLNGHLADLQRSSSPRSFITLDVNAIGYDIQIPTRTIQQLPEIGGSLQIFTHLQVREDQWILFGFSTAAERDLFRQLISVSGIGPQLGLALLDTFGLQDLIQAIVSSNTKLLSKTPGVGAKTAERIALELRTKLAEWREQAGLATAPLPGPAAEIQAEVEMTLLALGYSTREVIDALKTVGQKTALSKTANTDDWIREAIAWLSQGV
ncbi:Holliday junction branch migration protein RuvA [Altericista sp. CCNU0014]|uniref:Holliday junction branch migration protein RuvA n=1 Tax=Altericista sp. CCNU0014 TaxID=3082949 RepID=UPI00384A8EE6